MQISCYAWRAPWNTSRPARNPCQEKPPQEYIRPAGRVGAVCDTIFCHSTCGGDVEKQKSLSAATMERRKLLKCQMSLGFKLWLRLGLPFSPLSNLLQLRAALKMYISWNLIFCLLTWLLSSARIFTPRQLLFVCAVKVSQVEIMQNTLGTAKYYYAYARWACCSHDACGCHVPAESFPSNCSRFDCGCGFGTAITSIKFRCTFFM